LLKEFEGKTYLELLTALCEKDPSFKLDLPKSFEERISHSLLLIDESPCTTTPIDLPECDFQVSFLQLDEDILYTEVNKTLYVYQLSDLISPLDKIDLGGHCFSSFKSNNLLYLGGEKVLYIFKVETSLSKPLKFVQQIETKS
jgi:hypothetical protein